MYYIYEKSQANELHKKVPWNPLVKRFLT